MHKPMLASDLHPKIEFPVLASYKYDGVRATGQDNSFRARSLKLIPNRHIQSFATNGIIDSFDGELIVGKPNEEATFRRTTSAVMTRSGEPDFTFYIFDILADELFERRYNFLKGYFQHYNLPPWVKLIEHHVFHNYEALMQFSDHAIEEGYEGIVVRKMRGHYKHGRATKKEGLMLRHVPWARAEAVIIGVEEGEHNTNEATINELGHTNRSTHAENMVPSGRLGAFLVKDLKTDIEFKIGNGEGLTHELCTELWETRVDLKGKIINYKYKTTGGYDKPRQAQFMGFRDKMDMG